MFASASRRWDAIDDPQAYLRRAVVNRANDSHRKAFRQARHPLPVARDDGGEPELDGVWHFVQSLPTAQRTVVVLRYYADLALTDIVGQLGSVALNVHFEDRLEAGRMTFDYQLRPGVVRRSNALELMRLVGLADVECEPTTTSSSDAGQ